jgi:crossover junction endodeoxyribonuclease RusA
MTSEPYSIELPWPPSVNAYWRNVNGKSLISRAGRQYRQAVQAAVLVAGGRKDLLGLLSVSIIAVPPDARRRDIDNVLKAPLDGLAKAGVYDDDFQIIRLSIERVKPSKPGCLMITITEVSDE